MTSTGSSFSQVGARVNYLKAISTPVEKTLVANAAITSVMTQAAFTAQVTSGNGTSGMVYRDMGKTVTVVGSSGVVVAVYTLVQRQNAANTGVPDLAKVLVQTYSASTPSDVVVVRTG